jgi:aldehyde dehydrogenase (NAD+)
MEHHGSFYIDGRWVESTSPDVFTLISPATEQPFATIALGQRADVDCAVAAARREEGARLVCGGPGRPEGLQHGYFIRPTIFAGVTQEMTIAREEIFGPVLAVLASTDEAQAVHFANATNYGLGGYVFSADQDKAYEIGAQMRAGRIFYNGAPSNYVAPMGGYRQSGNGREMGVFGLEEYLEVKSMIGFEPEPAQ